VPTASASPGLPTTRGPRLACSHSLQTATWRLFVNRCPTKPRRKEEETKRYLGLLVLRVVLPVDVARRRLVRDAEGGVPDLRWEVILEVEEAGLAHVARLCAGLTDHRRLEAHARAWVPAEDGERAGTGSTLPSELLL